MTPATYDVPALQQEFEAARTATRASERAGNWDNIRALRDAQEIARQAFVRASAIEQRRETRRSGAVPHAHRATTEWLARAALRERWSISVEVVDGAAEPHVRGEGWCYRTNGGTLIRHPSAYSKHGWSNMQYHGSTLRIEVGREWPGLVLVDRDRRAVPHDLRGMRVHAMTAGVGRPTVAEIDAAMNEEYRRGLIDDFGGLESYIAAAGAETIHEDETGRLIRRTTAGEPITAVCVTCPSTGRQYMLRVPPTATTAREGIAWTFSLRTDEYQPTAQS